MRLVVIICFAAAFAFGLGYSYWSKRMIRGQKPGVSALVESLLNPLNICFRPELLTGEGQRARRWFCWCLCGLVLSILTALVLSAVLGNP